MNISLGCDHGAYSPAVRTAGGPFDFSSSAEVNPACGNA